MIQPGDMVRCVAVGPEYGGLPGTTLRVVSIDPMGIAELVAEPSGYGPVYLWPKDLERLSEVQEVS